MTTKPTPEPIMMRCEGSKCRPCLVGAVDQIGMCAMCGQIVDLDAAGYAVEHERRDILAEIARGDFDEGAVLPPWGSG